LTEIELPLSSGNEARMKLPVADILWLDEMMVIELESKLTTETRRLKEKQFSRFNVWVMDLQKFSPEEILQRIGVLE